MYELRKDKFNSANNVQKRPLFPLSVEFDANQLMQTREDCISTGRTQQ